MGATLVVVHIPTPGARWPGKAAPSELVGALSPSVVLVDVRDDLAALPRQPIALARDGHPNAHYHRLIADAIVERIRLLAVRG